MIAVVQRVRRGRYPTEDGCPHPAPGRNDAPMARLGMEVILSFYPVHVWRRVLFPSQEVILSFYPVHVWRWVVSYRMEPVGLVYLYPSSR